MRIFRTLLVLAGAGLLLPSPPEGWQAADHDEAQQPSVLALLASAGAAASDAASFCTRQPDVCTVAGYLADKAITKAIYSASLVWGWAGKDGPPPAAINGPSAALSVAGDVPETTPAAEGGQSTLELDDLIPEWREPGKGG